VTLQLSDVWSLLFTSLSVSLTLGSCYMTYIFSILYADKKHLVLHFTVWCSVQNLGICWKVFAIAVFCACCFRNILKICHIKWQQDQVREKLPRKSFVWKWRVCILIIACSFVWGPQVIAGLTVAMHSVRSVAQFHSVTGWL
jgi:hypothetical protein